MVQLTTEQRVFVVTQFTLITSVTGRSENVLKCLNVNTISLNSQMCNHARLRAL